jgi:hypothetical protein
MRIVLQGLYAALRVSLGTKDDPSDPDGELGEVA